MHLETHVENCHLRPREDINILISASMDSIIECHKFEPDVERLLFAKMVIKHDCSLFTVEYEYFRSHL